VLLIIPHLNTNLHNITHVEVTGFIRNVDEVFVLLGCYAANADFCSSTFQDSISVPSSWNTWLLKMGPMACLETSTNKYHHTLHNNPEQRRSPAHVVQICVSVGTLKAMLLSARQKVRRETLTDLQINVN